MAVLCPNCGHPYDVTLFQFGNTVKCDCGAVVRFNPLGIRTSTGPSKPRTESTEPDSSAGAGSSTPNFELPAPNESGFPAADSGYLNHLDEESEEFPEPPGIHDTSGDVRLRKSAREMNPEIVEPETVVLPIDGTLDLHAFAPSDVKELVPDYLEACREKGILRIRIIHGKGIGEMMRTVHAVLKHIPEVEFFELAGPWEGGSGATIAWLRPDPVHDSTKK
jgi:hypothetical protein